MKFNLAVTLLVASVASVASFSLSEPKHEKSPSRLFSAVQERPPQASATENAKEQAHKISPEESPLFGEEINLRLQNQMEKLRARDKKSKSISKEELDVVYQDDDIVVINKPAGVLSVPTREVKAALSESVYEAFGCEMNRADMMVVHRLAFDSSGIMVFCKNRKALRGMNKRFQTRNVQRKYEALVCGHMARDSGIIDLPIMRDYERPPFMRISTDEHQRKLINLESNVVGKKILEMPKESITRYRVLAREELDGQPVTRVMLTSVSGRTHQLNVHMAAIGHPIVGDKIYGYGGDALPNGGLTDEEVREVAPSSNVPDENVLKNIAVQGKPTCIHASYISFRHPVTKQESIFECDAPF
jgi:tRNA pseudouridine32 synthase/23S rRNA pseudouridine746 synthase